jgi:sRNA-binding regulator protein Hfq
MAKIIKTGWFGQQLRILLITGDRVKGELIEVADEFLVIDRNGTDMQIMAHAIVAISSAEPTE